MLATLALFVAAVPLDPANIRSAAAYSSTYGGVSLVVMVDGKIVFEEYPNGGSPDRAWELASGTKSFVGVLAAAAAADGMLSLDERVSDTLTEWKGDARRSLITVRQLLNLTSGIPSGTVGRPLTYAAAIAIESTANPGERFQYGPAPFQIFGELMRRKLEPRGETVLGYLERRIFLPLGVSRGFWREGRDGQPHLPSGAHLTARDWARFGEFVRRRGQGVVDAARLDECFKGSPANPAYGLTWWLNRPISPVQRGGIRQLVFATDLPTTDPWVPKDTVLAAGAGQQRLYVSRSGKWVVVRQTGSVARSGRYSDREFLRRLLGPRPSPE